MYCKILNCIMILTALVMAGCLKTPEMPETLEDYQREFGPQSLPADLPAGKVLKLQKAVEISLQNNPTNRAALQAVLAAKYGYYRAISAYSPEINVVSTLDQTLSRGSHLKNPPEGVMKRNDHFNAAGGIQASFRLFDGFARELATIIARQEYQKSMETKENVRRLLEQAVAYAYYDMYLAEEEIVIYQEDLDFQNAALQQEIQRFRSGHVSKASVLNFKILAARARSNISNARYRRQTACHALAALMGYDANELELYVLQKVPLDAKTPIHDDIFYLELAIRNRPDLKAEKTALAIAYRSKQKVIADFLPKIRLFSEFSQNAYHARYGGYRVSGAHSEQGVFTYGMEGEWNIFRGFDSFNKFRQQEVLEKMAEWVLNARFLEIISEVRNACASCRNASFQITVFQEMAQLVQEQRDLIFSEYRNGRETITRLNEAQSLLIEFRRKLVISAVEFKKSQARLSAAAGTRMEY